jgi:hypothetical protein
MTDVSGKCAASVFRVSQATGKMNAGDLVKTEAVSSSEESLDFYQTTPLRIPEESKFDLKNSLKTFKFTIKYFESLGGGGGGMQ